MAEIAHIAQPHLGYRGRGCKIKEKSEHKQEKSQQPKQQQIKCICCKKVVGKGRAEKAISRIPIRGGLVCAAYPSSNSRVFNLPDSEDDSYLVFALCDDCIIAKAELMRCTYVQVRKETFLPAHEVLPLA